jgi:hypothetical protein
MGFKKICKKRIVNSVILLSLLMISILSQHSWFLNQLNDSRNNQDSSLDVNLPHSSETDYYSEEWIKNGNFSAGSSNWYSSISGDSSDINMVISGGEAQYKIVGENWIKEFSDPINVSTASNWVAFNKSEPAINPDTYTIDNDGFYVSHSWHDATADQFTTISWRYNVSMGVDMSGYTITSAFIDAIMNATVDENIDAPTDDEARPGISIDQPGIFDHAIFYVELADMQLTTFYRVLYNKTNDLGQDQPPVQTEILSYNDKSIEQVGDEQDLIYYLTSLFDKDPGHDDLALIVGFSIECEDDYTGSDYDDWDELRIKSVNLTMSYEKKIDKLTKASWNQNGNTIPSGFIIDNATLNFKYKVDKNWMDNTGSINSEFRIIINENQLGETVKLSTATSTYQDFKTGGLDVSSFLSADEDVNVSIQIYIGDEFILDSNITISIDNVTLIIGYGIFTLPDTSSYNLILNDVDRTTEKSTEVTYNENLNVTFIYKNSTGDFISGADVQLSGGGVPPITLSEESNYYYKIINSSDLGVGITYLTLTASKRYHTRIEFQITITVVSRDTELQLFLNDANETINKEIEIQWNENLNITIKYLDIESIPGTHIGGATVELTGAGATKILDEDAANQQYEISINTSIFVPSSIFLTVYASLDNYTSLNIRFKVTVNLRITSIDNVMLNGTLATSIQVGWNELFPISMFYNDSGTGTFISEATVQLIGPSYLKELSESGNEYTETINSSDFTVGNNLLTILAQKDNYSLASQLITITVGERNTTLDIYLNDILRTAIELPYAEPLNITAIYKDATGYFLDGATVELRSGGTFLDNLSSHPTLDQYNLTIYTDQLSLGVNLLAIYAKKDNYTVAVTSIVITVIERGTSLEVFLNGSDSTSFEFYNISINQVLNITAIYNDFTDAFIDTALVQLVSSGIGTITLDPHPTFNQYNYTLKVEDLGIGVHFLVISAEKENYTVSIINVKLNVLERGAYLQLFVNETELTTERYFEAEIDQILNITVEFRDIADNSHISLANIRLTGALDENFTEVLFYEQYNVSILSNNLGQGINFLTIFAQKAGYKSESILFTIEVKEKDTDLHIYTEYDGIFSNKTVDRTLSIPIRKLLNITVNYFDIKNGSAVQGATIQLIGEKISLNLTENPFNHQYSTVVNTSQIGLGIRFLTIYCTRPNYQSYSALLRIEVNRIIMNVSTLPGGTVFNLAPRDDLRLRIRLTDLDFNISVLNAIVRYTWAYGQGDLTDENNDGIYEALLTDLPIGTFIISITVYAGDDYEFINFQVTMNVIRPPENVLLFQILTIAGLTAAIGVSVYLVAYQKILKYPKQVRKIHKFKSKLKKKKPLSIEISTRDAIIQKHYSEEIAALEKQIKRKLTSKSDITDIPDKKMEKIEKSESNSP